MVFYDVIVAFVGLNNNTIVYGQHRIWIRLVWLMPNPQKMTGADTDPEYWIDASLSLSKICLQINISGCKCNCFSRSLEPWKTK